LTSERCQGRRRTGSARVLAKTINISVEPGPDVRLAADQDLLLQLMLNLLDNAIKFTPAGGS
jgi:signal transduction histidine kinase